MALEKVAGPDFSSSSPSTLPSSPAGASVPPSRLLMARTRTLRRMVSETCAPLVPEAEETEAAPQPGPAVGPAPLRVVEAGR